MLELGEISVLEVASGWCVVETLGYGDDKMHLSLTAATKRIDAIRYANRLIKTFGEECNE